MKDVSSCAESVCSSVDSSAGRSRRPRQRRRKNGARSASQPSAADPEAAQGSAPAQGNLPCLPCRPLILTVTQLVPGMFGALSANTNILFFWRVRCRSR